MTNSRSTAKWAGERSCCGAATGVADRVVGIWGLVAVTLVLGLLAAAPVRALCINDGQGPDDQPRQKDVSGLSPSNAGAPRCYTCANDRATRCTTSQPIACTSVCSVGVAVGADPFSSSATHTATKCNGTNCRTNDTAVNCCLTSADIGTGGE